MTLIDTRLILGLLLATGCSDDGLAPADTDAESGTVPTSTTSATSDATGMAESLGGSSGNNDTADTSDPGTTGTGDDGSEDTGGTGAPPAICIDEIDCMLINDCCECSAVHVDDFVDDCPVDCKVPVCDELGIPDIEPVCEDDGCGLEHRGCADGLVTCDGLPPECPEGTLPEITPEGDCWTGACIPLEACDGVPSCKFCDEDEACVQIETQMGSTFRCDPIPEACEGAPTCECLPPETCVEPNDTCVDGEGVIVCSCPEC